jgi:hypothetical protein
VLPAFRIKEASMQVGSVQSVLGTPGLQTPKVPILFATRGYYDPKDTNQDGVVTAAENLAYSLKHPELDLAKPSSPTFSKDSLPPVPPAYSAKGSLNRNSQLNQGFLDLNG